MEGHPIDSVCDCNQCELRTVFFESFSVDDLRDICRSKTEIPFLKGETVFREGDMISYFSYLKSGLVKLFKTDPAGKDQIITIAGPFDFVSLLGVFSDTHHSYSVSVLEDAVLCCIDIGRIRETALRNARFSMNLMERMGAVSNKIIREGLEIRKRNTHGKVAYILLKFCKDIYGECRFDLPVSRREIAENIGITTENVIRTLSEFRKEKLIRINGKEIEVLDPAALERISNYG